MANKRYNILFTFPELSASHYTQFISVEASNLGLAVNRAFSEVKKRPAVKGRRIHEGKLTFTVEKDKEE